MIESQQLGCRAGFATLNGRQDGRQVEPHGQPSDDPQFNSLLSRVRSASDVPSFLNIFRSMLDDVISGDCTGERIALLSRLQPHIEMTLQRLCAQEDSATRKESSSDFAETAMRSSLQEPFSRLTPTEWRLVELVWEGCSNKEIAARLDKSIRTVKSQLTSVYKKFAVRSRSKLIALIR